MLAAIVVLHLMVRNCDTGAVLYEVERAMPSYANSIESCRKAAIEKARRLVFEYRKTYPDASANVDGEWRRGAAPSDPA
jgi:hypothetical protein